MHDKTLLILIAVVVLALSFDFINGFHDSANAIATSVLTRALSMRNAVLLAAFWNVVGAVIWKGVAQTIAKGIVVPSLMQGAEGQIVVLATVLAAITWNLLTWWWGLPSSSSHALIGALVGAGFAAGGARVLTLHDPAGIPKILYALIFSPIFGFLAGGILMIIIMNIFAQQAPSRLNRFFRHLQILSAQIMSFTHGSNDAQKSMGIITLALVFAGYSHIGAHGIEIPIWVKFACAGAMGFGTAMGGWRIIKTIGRKVMGLQPVHGFASETAASIVVLGATLLKVPVSTTHVISSAIMGVGSAKSMASVRWGIVGQILLAWLMTLPVCILLGAVSYTLIHAALK
jgi:PiT family inorganic phosphate transporter